MKITYRHEVMEAATTAQTIIDILLKKRNIADPHLFFHPLSPFDLHLADFGFKKEIKKTLELLETIKKEEGMIVVYTDYDADGITGGAILWETLHLLGFRAMPYVPHRKHEGYGFSKKGIDQVKKQYNPALIISVDHGITAKEKIAYAASLGIPIIITDHHLKQDTIPTNAQAIFHIPKLSGAGVSYFFSKMIYEHFQLNAENPSLLTTYFKHDYLALASIGTVADLVPLVGPSRSIVFYGLEAFSKITRFGLKHIIKESGIEGKKISPYEIGFIIAPRINAVGRLEHAIDALRLLCTTQEEKARKLAHKVGGKNRERQDLVKEALQDAKKQIERMKHIPPIITLVSSWHEGIIGLMCAKITEEYHRPTIIMTKADGFLKGSARSIPSFHITNFLRELKEYLIDVGGHAQAAGFTIEKKHAKEFIKKIAHEGKKRITKKDLEKVIEADIKIPLSKITANLVKNIEELAPFGVGNPQPVFYSQGTILDVKIMGKKGEHLKLILKDKSSFPLEFVSFFSADTLSFSKGELVDVVYRVEIDRWGGNEKIVGKIILLQKQKT